MNTRVFLAGALVSFALAQSETSKGADTVTQMDVFRVLEDPLGILGFDREVELRGLGLTRQIKSVRIYRVLPNTAASKAGLRPGDIIVASDGRSVSEMSKGEFDSIWREKQRIGQSGLQMSWDLLVLSDGEAAPRIVRLRLPAPAPWWGAPRYAAPEGRMLAKIHESGPLAETAKIVLDYGYWMVLPDVVAKQFGLQAAGESYLCYGWTIDVGAQSHMMLVSQQRSRTDVIFVMYSKRTGAGVHFFMADTNGVLSKAVVRKGRAIPLSPSSAQRMFAQEMELWTNGIRKGTRWPIEPVKPQPTNDRKVGTP